MTKIIEWIEVQVGHFTNFLNTAKEDLKEFDEKTQAKIKEYNNKQCGRAAIFGAVIGAFFGVIVSGLF